MITKYYKILLIFLFTIFSSNTCISKSNKNEKNRVLFVFDASQSMLGRWQSGRKIDIAKNLLTKMIDSLKNTNNLEVALRIYGHQSGYPPQDCDDTQLEVNFLPVNIGADRIKAKLSMIRARGTTPIAYSLEEAARDFPSKDSRNIVILITDGKEECGMDPCAISNFYQREGIILKPFVIGIGLDDEWKNNFDCVGRFFNASNESEFTDILNIVISHIVDNTTVQVNLLDQQGDPTESNINLTFYNDFTGVAKYNYIHTLNNYGNPDTMIIDPVLTYKIVAHTIPPVSVDSVIIKPGKHTIIPISTPQGELEIKMNSKINYQYIIRLAGVDSTLNIQEINSSETYLIGKYDIELLTLPRKKFYNVEVNQNTKTTYTIDSPGIANIILPAKGYGGIYINKKDSLEKIYSFRANKLNHRVTLLSGSYKIIFRAKSIKEYIYTKEQNFNIRAGKSELIKIQ